MDSLFDADDGFDLDSFAGKIKKLAQQNIFLGGSSWKYEGWVGQIYSRSRYLSRGRFSRKLFEETCLTEYASVFPVVCGDFSFYQFPSDDFWRALFARVPDSFRFALKVPEQITCRIFPAHPRYGAQSGTENEFFLDAALFRESFLRPLEPYREKIAVLIFEFGAFSPRAFAQASDFLDRLDAFLARVGSETRYAVEIRNADFLVADYFSCLRTHGVAHVLNAWTKMPHLSEQIAIPDAMTSDFLIARALLKQGRPYEEAVKIFAPYNEVREPNLRVREDLREILQIAREQNRTAFIFINNRLEGNAPGTMVSILDDD